MATGMMMPQSAIAAACVAANCLLSYVLTALLPGRKVNGYVLNPDGSRSIYKLNGPLVLFVTVICAVVISAVGFVSPTLLYDEFSAAAGTGLAIGLYCSVVYYIRGRRLLAAGGIDRSARCRTWDGDKASPTPSSPQEFDARSTLEHFYAGLSEFNPRGLWRVDIKMWLYVIGASQLTLNVLSCAAAQVAAWRAAGPSFAAVDGAASIASGLADGAASESASASSSGSGSGALGIAGLSWAMAAYALCVAFFIVEYLAQEEVHLFTYDIFRERIGFKLLFGCIFFYPFFYCVGALSLASAAPGADISPSAAAACVLLFYLGWAFTRGANLQKFALKQGRASWGRGPFRTELKTVPGSENRLLCSGFWRLARHANYCGEIVQAVAWALPGWLATGSLLPWAYPAYYVALFIPRERDDERMCAARYGATWSEYCRMVPWRIVPFVY